MTASPDAAEPRGLADHGDETSGAAEHVSPAARSSKPMEVAFATMALALGLAMLVTARAIKVRNETGGMDPRTWPTLIAIGIVLSAAWTLFNAVTSRRADRDVDPATRSGWVQLGVTLAMIVVSLLLWQVGVSFLVLAPIVIIVCNLAFGLRGIIALAVFPATLTAILYLVFQLLLKVPL